MIDVNKAESLADLADIAELAATVGLMAHPTVLGLDKIATAWGTANVSEDIKSARVAYINQTLWQYAMNARYVTAVGCTEGRTNEFSVSVGNRPADKPFTDEEIATLKERNSKYVASDHREWYRYPDDLCVPE